MGVFIGTISDDCIDTSSLSRHLQGPKSAALHWQCTVVLRRVERAFTCFLLVLDLCSKNWCRKRMLLCSGLCTHVLSMYDGSHLGVTVSCTKQKAAMNLLKTVSLFRRWLLGWQLWVQTAGHWNPSVAHIYGKHIGSGLSFQSIYFHSCINFIHY